MRSAAKSSFTARQTAGLIGLILVVLSCLGGCASWQAPAEVNDSALRTRAVSETLKGVTLSATVLSAADSQQLLGTDINASGVQPIWIEVRNDSSQTLWLLRSGTDPSYFSPLEVAWPLHTRFARKSNTGIDDYFNALSFDNPIKPGTTRSGILFTNPHRNTYVFNVDLVGQQTLFPFTLFLAVPGGQDAPVREAMALIAAAGKPDYTDTDSLRTALEQLPCCATGGDPLNMVFIGEVDDMGAAIIRRGYRLQRYKSDDRQLLYDRPPDIVLRKSGQRSPANWMRMWIAPLRYQGKPVILVQAGRPVGGRFATANTDQQQLHPNIDESRNLMIQDLMYSGGLAKLGFVDGSDATITTAAENADDNNRYHSDGLRAVLFFVSRPLALSDVEILDWVPLIQQHEPEAAANKSDRKPDE